MTDTIEWGPEIARGSDAWPKDQVRPEWLGDDDLCKVRWFAGEWEFRPLAAKHIANWAYVTAIRLPADHWANRAIAAGFVPHGGSETAPADWDGSEVLRWDGAVIPPLGLDWRRENNDADIIGYRRKPARDALPDDPGPPIMERRLLPDVPDGYVLVKQMTERKAEALWFNGRGPLGIYRFVELVRDLGIIRAAPTPIQRYEAALGRALTDAERAAFEAGAKGGQ